MQPVGFRAVLSRLNELYGNDWQTGQSIIHERAGKVDKGAYMYEITVALRLELLTRPELSKTYKDAVGGGVSGIHATAYEKAFQSAFCKAAAMLGIGEYQTDEQTEQSLDIMAEGEGPAPDTQKRQRNVSDETLRMVAEDGVPPGMARASLEKAPAPMSDMQRKTILKLATLAGRDANEWVSKNRSAIEAETMIKNLGAMVGPDMREFAGGNNGL